MRLVKISVFMVSVLLSAVLLLGLFSLGAYTAHLGGGGGGGFPGAVRNGDIDGNGKIALSDVVGLLRFIYQRGSPPVACAQSPGLEESFEAIEGHLETLTTILADRTLEDSVAMMESHLATIAAAVSAPPEEDPERFVDNGDGTVSDMVTGVMWEKRNDKDNENTTWQEAFEYSADLELGGYSDWRLPTVKELSSLVTHDWAPELDPVIGLYSVIVTVWSSELSPGPTNAWFVHFAQNRGDTSSGASSGNKTDLRARVLAVRTITE